MTMVKVLEMLLILLAHVAFCVYITSNEAQPSSLQLAPGHKYYNKENHNGIINVKTTVLSHL